MKLRNLSDKIINVNTAVVLPGSEIAITKAEADTPAMKALANFNIISLTEEEPKKAEPVEDEAVTEEEGEEKPKTARGRKASK